MGSGAAARGRSTNDAADVTAFLLQDVHAVGVNDSGCGEPARRSPIGIEWKVASMASSEFALPHLAFQALVDDVGIDDARDILGVFLTSNARRLDDMAKCANVGQRDEVEREAHSMKSAAAILGYVRLSEQARALEMEAAGLDHDELVRRIGLLAAAFAEVEMNGRQLLQTNGT
jgi:HPt (histidine-containing phosphotransfer) domain-containing protein